MGRLVNSDDLWDSATVGRYLGLGLTDETGAAGARAVSVYRLKYGDFPEPLYEKANAVIWVGADIRAWRKNHPARRRTEP